VAHPVRPQAVDAKSFSPLADRRCGDSEPPGHLAVVEPLTATQHNASTSRDGLRGFAARANSHSFSSSSAVWFSGLVERPKAMPQHARHLHLFNVFLTHYTSGQKIAPNMMMDKDLT